MLPRVVEVQNGESLTVADGLRGEREFECLGRAGRVHVAFEDSPDVKVDRLWWRKDETII